MHQIAKITYATKITLLIQCFSGLIQRLYLSPIYEKLSVDSFLSFITCFDRCCCTVSRSINVNCLALTANNIFIFIFHVWDSHVPNKPNQCD